MRVASFPGRIQFLRADCVISEGRAPEGGEAPERGNPPEGGVATLPTTLSAGLDCGDRGP